MSHILTSLMYINLAKSLPYIITSSIIWQQNIAHDIHLPQSLKQFAVASALVLTTTHQQSATHQAQRDVAPNCCYQGFAGSWQFFLESCRVSHCGSKQSLSPTACLNHIVIHKYLINTEPYINFSKYIDKLLVAKSLTNILKFTYFNIHFT